VVVLAILAILGTLAFADLSELKGRYRMNAAARHFVSEIESCRVAAISENKEYALVLLESDPTPLDGDWRSNHGRYEIRSGDGLRNSSNWEPIVDGVVDLYNGPGAWTGVSIEPWEPLAGPANYSTPDSIVFSPRGYLLNAPTDFNEGVLRIVFRNKASRASEARVVRVDMGGGAMIAATE
jgi:type II secretory pathway pseudopilin PulG